MDEIAEDREGPGVRVLERERDRIANAEAHTEVGSPQEAHTLHCKVYCQTNSVKPAG